MPSDGIDLENIPHYFAAGPYAVGVDGELADEALLTTGDDHELVPGARQFMAAVRIARYPKT
jgi:2-keto-3-deoxy-6-phosphogluconate aldolase